jgi:SPP1 gp7 family putative phage head morphogenesis protein
MAEAGAKATSLVSLAQAITSGWKKFSNSDGYGTQGAQYSPGQPLEPLGQEPKMYPAPWKYQYRVGQNLVITPRNEVPSTISTFEALRSLADNHDITRICIEIRKEQLSGMKWNIMPEDSNIIVKPGSNDSKQIDMIKKFWKKPDRVHTFYDWIGMVLEDILTIDALSLYKRKTRGGQLWALEPIDGTTIKCLIDDTGRIPLPPLAAYQQILYGYPMGGSGVKSLGFTTDDIIYRPKNLRPFTPYGFPPTEMSIVKVNIALRRDTYFLDYYTSGNMPDGGLYEVPENWTADQISQYQEMFDGMLSGNSKNRSGSLRFVPKGAYHATKEFKFESAFDQWLALIVANAFGVNPMHFIKASNRSVGDTQESIQNDIGLKPLQTYLENLFTDIIQNDLGADGLSFKWLDQKQEDQKMTIDKNVAYVKAGIYSIDQVLVSEGKEPIGVPHMIESANGPIYLTKEAVKAQLDMQVTAPTPVNPQMNPNGGNNETSKQAGTESLVEQSKDKMQTGGNKAEAKKAVKEELARYEKFVLNDIKKNKHRQRDFNTDIIPKELKKDIESALLKAVTAEEVKSIFRLAKAEKEKKPIRSTVELAALLEIIKSKATKYLGESGADFIRTIKNITEAKLIVEMLDDYEFVGSSFKNDIKTTLTQLNELGRSDAVATLERELGEITLDYPELRASKWASDYSAKLVTNIDESTRGMIRDTIQSSVKSGESYEELAIRLKENYGFSEARAEIIARTESANAYNIGACQTWGASGYCQSVYVEDGDYDATCQAINGSTWTIEQAMTNPTSHPNCTRQFYPIINSKDEGDK